MVPSLNFGSFRQTTVKTNLNLKENANEALKLAQHKIGGKSTQIFSL
jgi:hypothetical protein